MNYLVITFNGTTLTGWKLKLANLAATLMFVNSATTLIVVTALILGA